MRYFIIIVCLLMYVTLVAGEAEQPTSYLGRGLGPGGKTETRTAIRTLRPASGKGPAIVLVGVAHLGETGYFEQVQARLNQCDLVLYEGVGRPRFMIETAAETTDSKAWAQSAIGFLADIIVWYRNEIGRLPDSFRKLRLAVRLHNPKELAWLDRIKTGPQGWAVKITANEDGCTIGYFTNDKNGKSAAVNRLEAIVTMDTRASNADSLQKQLADALGLQFQLDAIDYSNPKFVNSDLTLSQLRARMRVEDDPEPSAPASTGQSTGPGQGHAPLPSSDDNELEALVKRMQGDDPAIRLAMAMAKGILAQSERGREMVKWVLGEALVNAEALMDGLSKTKSGPLADTADLMQVLIQDRNTVVMNDLLQAIKEQPEHETIAIFYGAAHMRDFQLRLEKELRLEVTDTEWLTVFSSDREKAGITVEQANDLRRSIREQMK